MVTEQVDSGTKVLGLEAVADSAGNGTIYNISRTVANRLAPDSAADTYNAVGGAITTLLVRQAIEKVEVEGAMRENIRIVCNPSQRTKFAELLDSELRGNHGEQTSMGFGGAGVLTFDGIPFIFDYQCQTDALFVVDFESEYIVMSKAPQLTGLAKVGAAEQAYIETYLAHVYEQPRRIHMLDTLS